MDIVAREGTWNTSVSEMMNLFRAGLLAVLPIADQACINWEDGKQYDDWDAIADGLYEGIVRMSVFHSGECSECMIPRYGFRQPSDKRCYILTKERSGSTLGVFVSFSSKETAFSHVRVQPVDEEAASAAAFYRFDDCEFVLFDSSAGREFSTLKVRL